MIANETKTKTKREHTRDKLYNFNLGYLLLLLIK